MAGWWYEDASRSIEVWTGDLAAKRLGLDPNQWQRLCGSAARENINGIIHNGASVNWNADYDKLRGANVQSVLELLEASINSPTAPRFIFVSGGGATDPAADQQLVAEDMADAIGYSQTKYVAESVVYQIGKRLPQEQNRFSIVKPGLIIGTAEEGVSNADDFIWRIFAASSQLGFFPSAPEDATMAVADAGFVASRILCQLTQDDTVLFDDISATSGLLTSAFWDLSIEELNQPCLPLSPQEWVDRALRDMEVMGEKHPLWPVQHFLTQIGFSESHAMTLQESDSLRTAIKKSVQYLQRVGLVQPDREASLGLWADTKRGFQWRPDDVNLGGGR